MRAGRERAERRRTREFEAFIGGAAGRLLHVATLLTCGDAEAADELLCHALARAYLNWHRLPGEDPYTYTRQELVAAYARRAALRWPHRAGNGTRLSRLTAQERIVLVLRLFEAVDEELVAAMLGIPAERVYHTCTRAAATLRSADRPARAAAAGPRAVRTAGGGR